DPERSGLRSVPSGRGGRARLPAAPRAGRRAHVARGGRARDREAVGPAAREPGAPAVTGPALGAVRRRRTRGHAPGAGAAARRRAVERYSVERMVNDYAALLEAL